MAGAPASILDHEDASQWTKDDVLDRRHLNPCYRAAVPALDCPSPDFFNLRK